MRITYQGKEIKLSKDIKQIVDIFGEETIRNDKKKIVAARVKNEVKSLDYFIKNGDEIELIDCTDKDGMRVYIRGISYIMCMAFNELYPDAKIIINYQLTNSMFCECFNKKITESMITKVKERMQEIIDADYDLRKTIMTKKQAAEFYDSHDIKEEDRRGYMQIDNDEKEEVSLYFCGKYFNYFYGVMPLSTGYTNIFDLKKYRNGFILQYPSVKDPSKLGEFRENKKFNNTLQEYERIQNLMEIGTIWDLNQAIRNNRSKEIILMSEALHEKKIAEIADEIAKKKEVKMVLIAGPSSSSKTTFAKRLEMQLKLNGMKPVTIGTDNYFVERENNPKDENGNYDFETIDALDLKLFNDHLEKLVNGEEIKMPRFNFKTGHKEYFDDRTLKLEEDEILVIEGIHCLNDELTSKIKKENKFKIYISDLTILNIDYYNRISTTDTRLIRRIVRDYNYRGYSALETLQRWPSVNAGEEKNIFPFQEEADAMFNSSLVYELAVLGRYARPLLSKIPRSEEVYSEAKRIKTFLEYFDEIQEEDAIPNNSLLREFIGGSVFKI